VAFAPADGILLAERTEEWVWIVVDVRGEQIVRQCTARGRHGRGRPPGCTEPRAHVVRVVPRRQSRDQAVFVEVEHVDRVELDLGTAGERSLEVDLDRRRAAGHEDAGRGVEVLGVRPERGREIRLDLLRPAKPPGPRRFQFSVRCEQGANFAVALGVDPFEIGAQCGLDFGFGNHVSPLRLGTRNSTKRLAGFLVVE